jgi:hypothetical protein
MCRQPLQREPLALTSSEINRLIHLIPDGLVRILRELKKAALRKACQALSQGHP